MAFNATARSASPARDDVAELPLWRLHLMRVDTSLWTLASRREMAGGRYDRSMPLFKGVVAVLLTAMSLLAFLELRYPVRLLPILLFECAWKLIWLAVVAVLAVAARDVDEATQEVIFSCSLVVITLAVVPRRYVWRQYVTAKGDRGR